jgi:hypothetical protein
VKKIIAIMVTAAFLVSAVHVPFLSAQEEETIIQKIATINQAKEIAEKAEGEYWEASEYWEKPPSPPVEGTAKVALPVQDEATGDVIGYIVAEKTKLISALNEAGLAEVANALAAAEAGTEAGGTSMASMLGGKTGWILLGVAVVAGIAIAAGSGGGGGGGGGSSSGHP